ncbi:hypothetical protein MVEG_08799 [Podila verticillata NRRL 6337]|nr:hypothetical protein MVEG_08799 [Podila verticillata NRRL 6337]
MAQAWPARRQPWPAIYFLVSLCVGALVRPPPTVSAEGLFFRAHRNTDDIKSIQDLHHGQWPSSNYACICLKGEEDQSLALSQCPLYPPHPFCPQIVEGYVEVDLKVAQSSLVPSTIATSHHEDSQDRIVATNQPASSPTIAGSTVLVTVTGHVPAATVTVLMSGSQGPASAETGHLDHGDSALDSATTSPSQPPKPSSTSTPPQSTVKVHQSSISPSTTQASSQPERHIPSYEQWRKQALEKKNKPAESQERKQRKRKPYQESPVDVAIGGEDELGFVFPNLDGNSGKGNDDRFQHLADQLGNGPDLKKESKAQEWIKSEYAKDPKDRFNHASATCAASVVKASKDATSIMAILNEGKDNYMLNKCSTKEKFFVVELCEEVLVDTFILGNYEFFSSTFKEFVVSVNRYPPRDDGWSVLGHFHARNTRDAQVFRPATRQLATYIRFDFVSHYGNEYYCPVTLLRVYGATALEQLKQEEEEEKRIAMEEKKQAELEKARQAAEEAEDADDDDDDIEVPDAPPGSQDASEPSQEITTAPVQAVDVDEDRQETTEHSSPSKEMAGTPDMDSPTLEEGIPHDQLAGSHEPDLEDFPLKTVDSDSPGLFSEDPDSESTFIIPEWPDDMDQHLGEQVAPTDAPPSLSTAFVSETMTQFEEQPPSDVLPPLPSTSPASMQDDSDWKNVDLGIITLSQKARPTHLSKPSGASKGSASGLGTTGSASATDSAPSHAVPSPGHSSQESVYKNIVNRLKVLELNSSLSYLYLEEQSNIFNEVIESSTQKINQLVNHLNEANRRLELLGRKYDQLSYSYRAHVEVDGEKHRKDFLNLSNQVHVLGAQVLFQRQLFVVAVITIITVFAFMTLTKSSTMHYAIQHSPLGAKLRAISGHRRRTGQNDIAGTVRIGSVESLSNFEQNPRRHPHIFTTESGKTVDEESKYTPPLSPMSPLTPNPNHVNSRLLDEHHQGQTSESMPDPISNSSLREDNGIEVSKLEPTSSKHLLPNTETSPQPIDSPEMPLRNPQFEQLLHARTPYPTPKHSYAGNGRVFLHSTPPPRLQTSQQSHQNPVDYRPESPVFQGPSSSNDAGQLSDADVAYMSRDMNVGRISSSGSLLPNTQSIKRLSASYYNQFHHSTARPSSSLRMDTTLSMASRTDSDSPDRLAQSPDILHTDLHASPDQVSPEQQAVSEIVQDSQGADKLQLKTERPYREPDEDVGFVSDSVLDSASESKAGSREKHLGDWDRQHGIGESTVASLRDFTLSGPDTFNRSAEPTGQPEPSEVVNGDSPLKDRPKLGREGSKNSRRRNSHSINRPQEHASAQYKNHSASATLGLGVGLGLELGDNDRQDEEAAEYDGDRDDRGFDSTDGRVPTWSQSPSSASVPTVSASSKTLKKKRSKKLLEDQIVPWRKESYDRESHESGHGNGALEDDYVDKGQEGDDERSPHVSRKAAT